MDAIGRLAEDPTVCPPVAPCTFVSVAMVTQDVQSLQLKLFSGEKLYTYICKPSGEGSVATHGKFGCFAHSPLPQCSRFTGSTPDEQSPLHSFHTTCTFSSYCYWLELDARLLFGLTSPTQTVTASRDGRWGRDDIGRRVIACVHVLCHRCCNRRQEQSDSRSAARRSPHPG